MAYFAEIDGNSIVVRVLVVSDENAIDGQNFLANTLGLGGTWIQTSYNTQAGKHINGGVPLRKNYAGIGYTYDPVRDAFYAPQCHNEANLDEETCLWNCSNSAHTTLEGSN